MKHSSIFVWLFHAHASTRCSVRSRNADITRQVCGCCASHYWTNELSPWQSDLSANGAKHRACAGGGARPGGQPGDPLQEAGARHLTPAELVKLSFRDNMLAGVVEANQPYSASIPAE